MKRLISIASILAAALWSIQAADTTVKLNNVHLCCPSCVKGIDKAVTGVSGATAQCDKDARTVTITAPDQATAQSAVDRIIEAGYFGSSSDPAIKVSDKGGAPKGKLQSLKITGVHLCCGKCVNAVNEALSKVKGVKANTAAKGADSFEVTGDFKGKAVFAALNKAGFAGKAAK
jgi:copper chaperone CopZ